MLDLSMVDVQPEVIRYNLVAAFRIRCSGCSFDPVQLSSADAGRNCFLSFSKCASRCIQCTLPDVLNILNWRKLVTFDGGHNGVRPLLSTKLADKSRLQI